MSLAEHFIKKRKKFDSSKPSLRSVKSQQFLHFNKNINKEYFRNPPYSINRLPKIKSDIFRTKKILENKIISSINQNQNSNRKEKMSFINLSNNSIFKMKKNILLIKKPFLLSNKIKPLLNNNNSNNLNNINFESALSNTRKRKKEELQIIHSKIKEKLEKIEKFRNEKPLVADDNSKTFIQTVNVYFKKNLKNSESTEEINVPKHNNNFPRTNSMFMTGMNFLINHNTTNNNNKENYELYKYLENNDNKTTLNSISFKELLKHIEENKKKIIDNQNDIDKMLKTAKDTHNEIWKCHRLKKIK